MFGAHRGVDAAAHPPSSFQTHEAGIDRLDKVVKDAVCDVLMEVPFISEGPHVELERLQFEVLFIGDVVENQRGKVRLAGERAQAGEFRNFHVNEVVALGVGIVENLKIAAGCGRHSLWLRRRLKKQSGIGKGEKRPQAAMKNLPAKILQSFHYRRVIIEKDLCAPKVVRACRALPEKIQAKYMRQSRSRA